jgi:hypothetical protein
LLYMIPQTLTLKEPCSHIFKCADQLKACNFAEFWKIYNNSVITISDPVIQTLATQSVSRLQASIMGVLALSYKKAPVDVVKTACNIDSVEVAVVSNSDFVESVTADSVFFKASADNTKRQRVYQEGVSFATISSLLSKIAQ